MLNKTAFYIDKTNNLIGHIFSYLSLLMVLFMAANVFFRYIFQVTLIWQQELVVFFHAILFLSTAGYTLLKDKHVRVDIFYTKFSNKNKAIIDLFGTLFLLLPFCWIISYYSYDFIISSWQIYERSVEYNGMVGIFILKSFIWLFTFTLFIQGISTIIKSIEIIKG